MADPREKLLDMQLDDMWRRDLLLFGGGAIFCGLAFGVAVVALIIHLTA